MKWLAIVLLALGLAACQSRPDNAAQGDSDALARARVHTDLAAGYFSRKQYDVALQELEIARQAYPRYAPAHNMLGLVYMELRDLSLAQQSFQTALSINPNDSDTHHNFATFLCQNGRYEEAIGHFLKAIENPLYMSAHRSYANAGVCARKAGDISRAQSYFEAALKLQPLQADALFNMADLAYARGDYQNANIYLGRLLRASEPSAARALLAIKIARKVGDRNLEESQALVLRRHFPNSPEALAWRSGKLE